MKKHKHHNSHHHAHQHGNQVITGTDANEFLIGGHGNDTISDGGGSDIALGRSGDDTLIFTVSENEGSRNYFDGGRGNDTLQINLTVDEFRALQDELVQIQNWVADNANDHTPGFGGFHGHFERGHHFGLEHHHHIFETSFGLTFTNIENVLFNVDGFGNVDPTVPLNYPPEPQNDSFTTNEDTALVIQAAALLANDTDADGNTLTVTAVDATALDASNHVVGSVSMVGEEITFTPNANYSGTALFNYTVSDGLDSSSATVSVDVTPVADAPVINIDAAQGDEDTAIALNIGLQLTDTDGSETLGDVTISGVPADALLSAGTLQLNGDWVITQAELTGLQLLPAPNYNGDIALQISVDSTETANGDSANATKDIIVTVNPINDAPVATDDSVSGFQNQALVLAAATLLANDTDVDNDALSISSVQHAVNGTVDLVGNDITFTPDHGFIGTASFEYTVADGHGGFDTAVTSIDVQSSVPETHADTFNFSANVNTPIQLVGNVLTNDVDPLGGTLTVTETSMPVSDQTNYSWNDGNQNITLQDTNSQVTVHSDGSVDVVSGFYNGYYDHSYEAGNALQSAAEDFTLAINVEPDGTIRSTTDNVDEVFNGSDNGEAIIANTGDDFITGNGGNDVIVGDFVSDYAPPQSINLAFSMDFSGSMSTSTVQVMKDFVISLVEEFDAIKASTPAWQGLDFNVHVNGFSTHLTSPLTFHVSNAQDLATVTNYIDNMPDERGYTNYDLPLQDTQNFFLDQNPSEHDFNYYYFISDGQPYAPGSSTHITATSGPSDFLSFVPHLYTDWNLNTTSIAIGNFNLHPLDFLDNLQADGSPINISNYQAVEQKLLSSIQVDKASDHISGGEGNDIIFGDGIDTSNLDSQTLQDIETNTKATIEAHHEEFNADNQNFGNNDIIHGDQGNDIIYGQVGNDQLFGDQGNDTINGGVGNDILHGGAGADILTGGAGADTFDFNLLTDSNAAAHDTITDFTHGEDIIDLVDLAPDGIASIADLTITNDGTDTTVAATNHDFEIHLSGVHTLDHADFHFA